MKPNTYTLAQAIEQLQAEAEATLMVGDSATDVEAGHAYGILVVGYVNEAAKFTTLAAADVLVTDMLQLAGA